MKRLFQILLLSMVFSFGVAHALTCSRGGPSYEVGQQVRFVVRGSWQQEPDVEKVIEGADPASFVRLSLPIIYVSEMGTCPRPIEYGMDKNAVYYRGQRIEGADPGSFMLAGDYYAKDRFAIYYKDKRLTTRVKEFRRLDSKLPYSTDGEKVFDKAEILEKPMPRKERTLREPTIGESHYYAMPTWGRLAKDKNAVYFDGIRVAGADPQTVVQISSSIFKDRTAVYSQGIKLPHIDLQTMRLSKFEGYLLDKNGVYFKNGQRLPDRDPLTFVEVSPGWTKDENGVYYFGTPFDADPETFTVMPISDRPSQPAFKDQIGHAGLPPIFIDRNAVYLNEKKLPGIDPKTVRRPPYGSHLIDDKGVYRIGINVPLPDRDPQSFEELDWRWSRDKNRVYYFDQPFAADPQTLTQVSYWVFKDRRAVYLANAIELRGADPQTFTQVSKWIFKDRRAVYYNAKELPGVNPETMRVSRFGNYVIDGDAIYRNGERLFDRDAKTFEEMEHFWTKDKNGVYLRDNFFSADPKTFTQIQGSRIFKDQNALYTGYFDWDKWHGIDPAKVYVTESSAYVIDDRVVYHRIHGLLFGRDPHSFEELGHLWTKDKSGIYYDDEPVAADLATFEVIAGNPEGENFRFEKGRPICKFNSSHPAGMPLCARQ